MLASDHFNASKTLAPWLTEGAISRS